MVTVDFLRVWFYEMINLTYPLAVLATRLPWATDRGIAGGQVRAARAHGPTPRRPGPVRPHGGVDRCWHRQRWPPQATHPPDGQPLLYLKHSFNLSDEELVVRWSENVLWQFFSGMDYFEHWLPCDATQIGRFRRDLGEDGMEQLRKATINTAVAIKAVKPIDPERVTVDTTVQKKAIAHPVDSRLLEIARHKVVSAGAPKVARMPSRSGA